jgi:hypothetical protein
VIVIALASASLASRAGDARRVVTGGLAALPGGTTERLAAAGLAGRTGGSSVWTGKELLVWGGLTLVGSDNRWLADGAALDPSTNRWRPLPPAPIAARSYAATVWTGTEMLVWGGGGPNDEMYSDGAAFDPKTNRWRTIASQPDVRADRPAAVWTGREMVVISTINTPLTTSAYDPKADRWRRLTAPPGALAVPYPQVAWTGSELLVVLWPTGPIGTAAPGTPPRTVAPLQANSGPPLAPGTPPPPPPVLLPPTGGPDSDMFLASYSPSSDTWSRLPPVALRNGSLPRLIWTGREVLLLQSSQPSAAFDPKRQTWQTLSPIPAGSGSPAVEAVWTGHLALFWSGGATGLAYDPDADVWRTFDAGGLASREDAVVAWTDGYLIGWSGFDNRDNGSGRLQNDGVRYRPPSG